jgi:hypothetical protein
MEEKQAHLEPELGVLEPLLVLFLVDDSFIIQQRLQTDHFKLKLVTECSGGSSGGTELLSRVGAGMELGFGLKAGVEDLLKRDRRQHVRLCSVS